MERIKSGLEVMDRIMGEFIIEDIISGLERSCC